MACILTSGYSYLGCRGGAGGIKAIYLTEFENNSGTVQHLQQLLEWLQLIL